MKRLLRWVLAILFKIHLLHFHRLKFNGPTVIIPNHVSFLDGLLLYLFLPGEAVFVVNTHIARRFAFWLKFCPYITVDPLSPYSLKRIIQVVKSGVPVVLFPEGRITTTGTLMKIYDGVAFVALKTGATLYPLILSGPEYSRMSRLKGKIKSRLFPEIQLLAGKPFQFSQEKATRQKKRELSNKILEHLQNNLFQVKHRDPVNLFNQLLQAARVHGYRKPAVRDITQQLTYRSLIIASYILARRLARLLQNEKNAGLLLPNSAGQVVALFALFYSGKVPAVLNFSAGIQNLLDCSKTAGIKTILTSRLFIEKAGLGLSIDQLAIHHRIIYLEDIRNTLGLGEKILGVLKYRLKLKGPETPVQRVILFTSGSENKPKGVVLTHSNLLSNIHQVSCVIDFTHQDRILNALPMFHSFGLNMGTLLPILSGVEVYLYPSPLNYKVIPELAYDFNATILFGTSTFLTGYGKYAHPYDFYRMRYVIAGAEKLQEETRTLWMEKFGIRILEGYGTTETSPVLSLNTGLFYKKGTVGRFLPGIRWKLAKMDGLEEGGNLLVQGPNIMEGYLLQGRGFVPVEEWYDCGDVVSVDDQGFITIHSRLKRFAKVSGEMVSLNLVEELSNRFWGTRGNAAISLPDHRRGEKIILFATEKRANRQAFRQYLSQHHYSMLLLPSQIIQVDKLPLLGSGKTDYVTLRNHAEKGADKVGKPFSN